MNQSLPKPLWQGVVLVAGGAVGAGMFALPMASAGAWTLWSFVGMTLIWWLTYLAAKVLLDTNLAVLNDRAQPVEKNINETPVQGPPTSFDTLVNRVLGPRWALLNNLSLVFIMMILMYAYISAGASIMTHTLEQLGWHRLSIDRGWLSLCFAAVVAIIVWLGTTLVARISMALMMVMAISFLVVAFSLLPFVSLDALWEMPAQATTFIWSSLPVYVTAFACAGLVPSLVKHYNADRAAVQKCLLFGTLLALVVYVLWLAITFGSVGRDGFRPILAAGGNTGDLVASVLKLSSSDSALSLRLSWFSHCAIITSFLCIGLGLFHFVQDKLSLKNDLVARGKGVALCFLPAMLGSFFYPKGFLLAIGYAGLLVAFSFFVIPAMMYLKRTKTQPVKQDKRVLKIAAAVTLMVGAAIALLKSMSLIKLLPTWA